jgi:hypothetical protein
VFIFYANGKERYRNSAAIYGGRALSAPFRFL